MIFPVIFFSCRQDSIEIYISPGGSDSGAGTKENPVRTVEKANELAAEAFGKKRINIIFEDGIHYLPETIIIKADNSGTSKYPVTYMAANEGKAVISGGKKLNLEWESYKNGIYKAGIPGDVSIDQLYINGERQRMARFPNAVEGKNVFDTWDLIHTREPDQDNDPLGGEICTGWSKGKKRTEPWILREVGRTTVPRPCIPVTALLKMFSKSWILPGNGTITRMKGYSIIIRMRVPT